MNLNDVNIRESSRDKLANICSYFKWELVDLVGGLAVKSMTFYTGSLAEFIMLTEAELAKPKYGAWQYVTLPQDANSWAYLRPEVTENCITFRFIELTNWLSTLDVKLDVLSMAVKILGREEDGCT